MLFKKNRRKGAKVVIRNKFYVLEWVWVTTAEEIEQKRQLAILNEKIRLRDLARLEAKKTV